MAAVVGLVGRCGGGRGRGWESPTTSRGFEVGGGADLIASATAITATGANIAAAAAATATAIAAAANRSNSGSKSKLGVEGRVGDATLLVATTTATALPSSSLAIPFQHTWRNQRGGSQSTERKKEANPESNTYVACALGTTEG